MQPKFVALTFLVLWSRWSFEGAVADPQLFLLVSECSGFGVPNLSNFYQNLNASFADLRAKVRTKASALTRLINADLPLCTSQHHPWFNTFPQSPTRFAAVPQPLPRFSNIPQPPPRLICRSWTSTSPTINLHSTLINFVPNLVHLDLNLFLQHCSIYQEQKCT